MSPRTAAFGTTYSPAPLRFRNSPPRSGSRPNSLVQQTPTLSRRPLGLKIPFSPAQSCSAAPQYSLSHPLSGPTRTRVSRPSPLLLWLRVGDLRICDNPVLLHASRHGGPVLPVVSVSGRDLRRSRVVAALRDLRRGLVRRGSELHVVAFDALGGDRAEREAVARIVRQVRAEAVVLSGEGEGVLGGVRVVGVGGRDVVLCSGPSAIPGSGEAGRIIGEGVVRGVGVGGGEEEALRRLRKLLQEGWWRSGEKVVQGMVRRELWLGCVSRQRVAQEVRFARERWGTGAWSSSGGSSADGLIAGLCMSSAAVAYDVNGGDRRGIEWDADHGVFRLREWEHAETERRMNAAQRGSEFVRRRKMFLGRVFFPDDVTPDYYSFTAWRFAQRCVSATVGVFGTQALLLALGVKAGRIGQAAAISWVLKDGLGRVGKMLWAGSMGKDFDVDPKRWRFRSALLYALGNGMEIVTQIFPASFLVVATIANSMKQVSMLTSSATRNAMYRSFGGRAQNIANITAKGEAQIVVADLIGMACGIQLSKTIGTSKGNVLAAYTILTALDIFGIYMELRQVVFRTLNAERSSLVIEEYVKSGRILRPSDVSRRERIFLKPRYRSRSRFSSIIKAARTPEELDMLLHVFRNERFLVTMPPESAKRAGKRSGPCRVVLRNDARHEDVLRALLTVGYVLDRPRNGMRVAWLKSGQSSPESVLRAARRAANKAAPELSSELRKAGWNVDNLLFGTVKRGASWGTARIAPTSAP